MVTAPFGPEPLGAQAQAQTAPFARDKTHIRRPEQPMSGVCMITQALMRAGQLCTDEYGFERTADPFLRHIGDVRPDNPRRILGGLDHVKAKVA